MTICLDAVPTAPRKAKKMPEDVTYQFCKKLSESLQAHDITVVITREENEKLTPRQRIRLANESAADFVFSVNIGPAVEVWVPSRTKRMDDAQALMAGLLAVFPEQKGRYASRAHPGYPGNPSGNYRINRETSVDSIVVKLPLDKKLDEFVQPVTEWLCKWAKVEYCGGVHETDVENLAVAGIPVAEEVEISNDLGGLTDG